MKRVGLVLLLSSLLSGCAARKHAAAELYWAPNCIENVTKGLHTRCTGNVDKVSCQGVKVTLKKGCEVWTPIEENK